MTGATAAGLEQRATARVSDIPSGGAAIGLLAGLGAVVALRALAVQAGLDPLATGAAFGLALGVLAFAGGGELVAGAPARALARSRGATRRTTVPVAIGVIAGLGLVALVAIGAAVASHPLIPGLGRSAAPFAPWASITILVAGAEEALLRGRLFGAVQRSGGIVAAITITSVAFALMHVPVYGWHVVPLDLAVGVMLGGLRVATRSVAAPAAAHAVADLATWWI
jgi:membrane protease YdiL (CAAX protease family)